ncbi:SDR family NAD(P)-dependent oxidoreductase [Aliarcobacter butzleri]|uniref:SDR family NAD(P)-dependent oxidoreductase n=1 Tax=Aliarcobacter butzleri TaxID=28197 RepID=UPI0024DE0A9A|nr:SDR family NAD(P)-dependent oxidoreductase [Aliarcobacter butzleri]MDK2081933.1 SDR family NAD(P)-dependent oxidoreductase [Aliarcobacter butzleri]
MKIDILFIITGTTQGLGKELERLFSNNNILTLNRKLINNSNMVLDLSEKNINLDEFNNIIDKYEKIFFISNASIIKPIKNIRDITNDDLDISIHTNFINQAKIIMKIVQSNKKYSILNITSGAAFTSNTELSLYSSSKAAMHRFVEILKKEEINNPNALYIDNFDPGRMQTEMQKDLISQKKLNLNIEELNTGRKVAEDIYQILGKYINE